MNIRQSVLFSVVGTRTKIIIAPINHSKFSDLPRMKIFVSGILCFSCQDLVSIIMESHTLRAKT